MKQNKLFIIIYSILSMGISAQNLSVSGLAYERGNIASDNKNSIFVTFGRSIVGEAVNSSYVLRAEPAYSFSNNLSTNSFEGMSNLPNNFSLDQNYPNPFNPTTQIKFSLPTTSFVTISIYNVIGEKLGEVVNKTLEAGVHTVSWNATNYANGIYIYTMNSGNFFTSKKMILLK